MKKIPAVQFYAGMCKIFHRLMSYSKNSRDLGCKINHYFILYVWEMSSVSYGNADVKKYVNVYNSLKVSQ